MAQMHVTPVLQAVTGADLPPELVDKILRACVVWDVVSAVEADEAQLITRLGAFSLVCKYWAKLCRPRIFCHLKIRGREDFVRLLKILDTPPLVYPPVAECIREFDVTHTGTWGVPWLHQLFCELSQRRDVSWVIDHGIKLHLKSITVEISKPDPGSGEASPGYAPCSLNTSLPRDLPPKMFPFKAISLTDLRFKEPRDLVHLVHSMRRSGSFDCRRLSFDSAVIAPNILRPRQIIRRRAKRFSNFLDCVTISQCGSTQLEIELLLLMVFSKNSRTTAMYAHWNQTLKSLALCTVPSPYHGGRCITMNNETEFGFFEDSSIDQEDRVITCSFDLPNGELVPIRMLSIRIQLDKEFEVMSVGWKTIQDVALEYNIGYVEVVLQSKKTFLELLDAVQRENLLSELLRRRKLRLAFDKQRMVMMQDVVSAPTEYTLDNMIVSLSRAECLEMLILQRKKRDHTDMTKVDDLLRCILASRQTSCKDVETVAR